MPPTFDKVWDVHHQWVNETGYIDRLLKEIDRLGIERTGLIAMGDFGADLFILHDRSNRKADNHDLAEIVRQHSDRLWGWVCIRLGQHNVDDVDRLTEMGMDGLKFHAPLHSYDDPDYFPVYDRV